MLFHPSSHDKWKEQYTIALKQGLITHFMFVEDDERLDNYNTMPGKFAEGDAQAHVLYLAMKFKTVLELTTEIAFQIQSSFFFLPL